ncbi:MAG: type II secretion system protein [Parvularcula sp.]|jgi:prepilin-type N-terminal cleavage/methylation domain-containing protein|nr:type II secretion system protein [Parvularcula sp.]
MAGRAGQTGFTLIETLAALGVIGVMLAIVLPNLTRGLDRSAIYAAKIGFAAEVQHLRRRAFREGRDIVVAAPGGEGVLVGLEEGWSYRLNAPIVIDASGRCSGGVVSLFNRQGLTTELRLEAPKCTEPAR